MAGFKEPNMRHGLRRVPLSYKIITYVTSAIILLFLTAYLYLQALDFEISNETLEEGSFFSPLFFTSLGGALLALPLVVLVVWSIRRTFVQPVFIYVHMFLHGAGFSVLASLVASGFTMGSYDFLIEFTQSNPLSFYAIIHAPVFEELFKGVGLLLMLLSLPFFIRTPHDGAIYGMLIGFGFAFTENVQYFVQHGNTAEGFVFLLFMRIFASLLTHAVFTAATGLLMAYFWCKRGSYSQAFGGWILGYVLAVSLHALWNGAASIGLFLVIYVLMFLPMFVGVTVLLRKTAAKYDRTYIQVLEQYDAVGWFSSKDYQSLFPKEVRKRKLRFLSKKDKKKLRFLASALSELVFVRLSIEASSKPEKLAKREEEILVGLYSYQKVEIDEHTENPNKKPAYGA